MEFLKKYKFTIAFENESFPGYTTEKIFEPMLVNSIPIYWGNPEIHRDFNTESFISYHDFNNEKELIDYIIEVDNNDELYLQILEQPYFKDNIVNEDVDEEKFNNWLKKTLDLCLDKTKEQHEILVIKPKISKFNFTIKKIQFWTKWTIRISKTFSFLKIKVKLKKWISG